ncbi:SRPBCC family protein [Actinomadura alba]|uniref:SRPBCC domain-containing protein n=1 Tax=Actinomadura alba TaxID=406431 RepID=A0ABR7LRC3_9ACTN|nr:SRPBCC family protein [Actinomadura alba]MBC6467389.1 SRPBCC domain-containing protein [Actinomadura alba]
MSQPVDIKDAVRQTITVPATPKQAFQAFTEQFGLWWPQEYSIGKVAMADFVVEPRAGGRWYEVGVDGTECDTGRVTAYEPPDRLVLAWHLDGNWQFDPDPAHASEVEVRFVADGNSTRVELVHRYFERHGAGAPAVRAAVESTGGWGNCMAAYLRWVAA